MKESYRRTGRKSYWYGKHLSEETKEKLRKERNAKTNRRVICIETGEIYRTIKDAGEAKKLDRSSIAKCCKGKKKTCGGYHWRYADEQNQD